MNYLRVEIVSSQAHLCTLDHKQSSHLKENEQACLVKANKVTSLIIRETMIPMRQ